MASRSPSRGLQMDFRGRILQSGCGIHQTKQHCANQKLVDGCKDPLKAASGSWSEVTVEQISRINAAYTQCWVISGCTECHSHQDHDRGKSD
eukprot:1160088-Pelagomonas_calceolata.AAC.16